MCRDFLRVLWDKSPSPPPPPPPLFTEALSLFLPPSLSQLGCTHFISPALCPLTLPWPALWPVQPDTGSSKLGRNSRCLFLGPDPVGGSPPGPMCGTPRAVGGLLSPTILVSVTKFTYRSPKEFGLCSAAGHHLA
ncbi:hypothetical protein SKAU_G00031360 [Synaphobranchus kaupii]|uniref:Uncharacterized protein n=1 Tax=Synaphobranchus kaupii TaxID=118154 RepID=A0A9Q1GET5_SYNKA|nr:hypothetical protein SKAU_G00031360 [Synaphobranchus kaupii]